MRKTPAERLLSPLTIGVLVAVVVGPMAWALVTSLKTEANVITFPPPYCRHLRRLPAMWPSSGSRIL